MNNTAKLTVLALLALGVIGLFLFFDIGSNWGYVMPRRAKKILAIALTGGAIAFSTMIFQTITNNRILTPSIIGLDSLYMLLQTFIVYAFGSTTLTLMSKNVHFVLSVSLMVVFAGILFKLLFRGEGRNIYYLLLVGLIFGTLFQSFASFMQVLIDPNEFLILQDRMFASFNNINTDLLVLGSIGMALTGLYYLRFAKFLDVLSLGREHAVGLGIPYDHVVKRLLIIVAVLISISTALVGPITFLGLLVANVTCQFLRTYKHSVLIPGAMLISIIALVGGQFVVERVFTFSTTVSVIVNLVGGIYFIYLLLKENRSW
ncbi:iron complex transport system permease protein [Paenibacillus mucilaginosus]|uniref:iron chelate uptake ABC transporter family permease subunit n=1 Tax=Paenibacillus mucilaginosus TaxID=61624 RepID=UPI003D207083